MMRGKREKALLSAACLAVALLFAACEGELAPVSYTHLTLPTTSRV